MIPEHLRCRECSASFNTPAELEYHTRTAHSRFACGTCGQTFALDNELEAHNREMHPEKEKMPAD